MSDLFGKTATIVVAISLLLGTAFQVVALATCEFLVGSTESWNNANQNVGVGLFSFRVDDIDSDFHTAGHCERYGDWPEQVDTVPYQVHIAQVFAVIAAVEGFIFLILILVTQYCVPIPCHKLFINFTMVITNVAAALVWLVNRNEVCDQMQGGCAWGNGAGAQLLAQIFYFGASVLSCCLPHPTVRHAKDRAERAEGKALTAEQQVETLQQQVDELQAENEKQKRTIHDLEERSEELKRALADATATAMAAATAATANAIVGEAVKREELKTQLYEKEKELTEYERELNVIADKRDLTWSI